MPKVTGPLDTTAPSDTYPTHDSLLGVGGVREVANHAARNAISTARRRQGMIVYTVDDDTYWTLKAGPWTGTDTDWRETFVVSGGGGPLPTRYDFDSETPWVINHALADFPSVDVYDTDGNQISPSIRQTTGVITVTHANPESGFVIVRQ